MRSPKNTLKGSRDLKEHVDSRLSQTVALLVVTKMMSGLTVVELCCGLEDR